MRIFCSPVVGEADIRVAHEAQDGLLVLDKTLMEVVRVGLGDPSAFPFRSGWDFGRFLRPLGQDGPVPLDDAAAFGLGQRLGRTLVDPVAELAQQLLHQACPAEAVGVDDEGQFAEHVGSKMLRATSWGPPPSAMALTDFDTALLGDFLSHLETERGNDARTRNTRLAAIRSFFRFVALQEPRHAALAQRVLAIPDKRYTRRPVAWLERHEIEALLGAPDPKTRTGRRDRTLLLVAVQTGLRASELTGLRCEDVQLGTGAHVRCRGKGRKERCTPLRKDAAKALRAWLAERRGEPNDPVFPNQRGGSMSHDSLGYLLSKHVATARARCPSLAKITCQRPFIAPFVRNGAPSQRCRPRGHRIVARS